jgi:hypothetical protein
MMKKSLTLFIFGIFMVSFALAADNSTSYNSSQIKEVANNMMGGLNEKTEDVLQKQIDLPEPISLILGLPAQTNWGNLILTISYLALFFIIVLSVMAIFPLINSQVLKIIFSLIITLIVSLSGGIAHITAFFWGWISSISNSSTINIIFSILIALVIALAFFKVGKILQNGQKIGGAKKLGRQISQQKESLNVFAKAEEEMAKDEN